MNADLRCANCGSTSHTAPHCPLKYVRIARLA
nr:MAG TPA: nucleic-acid-binding protein [Caudoviricetes sp.]